MKILLNKKMGIKSLGWLFVLCIALTGCKDNESGLDTTSISFGVDNVVVLDDVGTGLLQLEFTEPLTGRCDIYLECDYEETDRFTFPEYISLGEGAVRAKYPIYVKENKFSSLDKTVTFTIVKVSSRAVVDPSKSKLKFTIEGKKNAGEVVIGFANKKYSIGEDQSYFELPFKVDGVLEDSIKLNVKSTNGTAVLGTDFNFLNGTSIKVARGDEWNYIPFKIFDDLSQNSRTFTVTLESTNSTDTLVNISKLDNVCEVTIKNVERRLRVTDSLVETPEYIGKIAYNFNLTATVPGTVTANVVVDTEKSTAIEGEHFELVETKIEIAPGETKSSIEIEIIDEALGNTDRKIFLNITDAKGVDVSEVYGVGEIVIMNDDNSVGFKSGDLIVSAGEDLKIPITIEGTLDEELTFEFEIVKGMGNATSPSDFSILSSKVKVMPGENVTYLDVATVGSTSNKNFHLKLVKIKGSQGGLMTKTTIDKNRSFCEVTMIGKIDKDKWKLLEGSSVGGAADPAINLIDDDYVTKWHNDYSLPDGAGNGPWSFIIDMADTYPINVVRLQARTGGNNDATLIEVYISNEPLGKDDAKWDKILTHDWTVGTFVQRHDIPIATGKSGRYMMLKVLTGRGGGIDVGCMSEIGINPID